MDVSNPKTRTIIYRCVGILVIAAGYKVGTTLTGATSTDYLAEMKRLSETYVSLEKSGQDAMAQDRDPQALFQSLTFIYGQKNAYVRSLASLQAPAKFREFHAVLVEWRQKEIQNEGQILAGFQQYAQDRSQQTSNRIDALTKANEEIGRTYEAKTLAIAKKNGFDSIEKFLTIRRN